MTLPENYGGNGGGGVEVQVRGYKSGEECMRENKKNEKKGREWAGQRVKRWVKMSGGEGD